MVTQHCGDTNRRIMSLRPEKATELEMYDETKQF